MLNYQRLTHENLRTETPGFSSAGATGAGTVGTVALAALGALSAAAARSRRVTSLVSRAAERRVVASRCEV